MLMVGAFVSGLPVQPLCLKYSWTNRNPAYTSSFLSSIFVVLTGWSWQLEVRELPVYFPRPKEQQDPAQYAESVQLLMAAGLGVPCSNITSKEVLRAYYEKRQSSGTQVVPAAPGGLDDTKQMP